MKKHTLSWWKHAADKTFSLYIRRRESDRNGNVVCVTCDKIDHWKRMHCGHYIPRNHLSTRFDERNVACQCPGCNLFGAGKHDVYAIKLISKYGKDILADLNAQKNRAIKYTISNYQEMIDKWTDFLAGFDVRDRGTF